MTAFEVNKGLQETLPSIEKKGFLKKPFHTAYLCVAVRSQLAAA